MDDASIRLAMELERQELQHLQPTALSEDMLAGLDDETRQSIELVMRLEEEERARVREQAAAAERLQDEPEDEDSIALAMRLQQEDDEAALSNALGVGEDEAGSPSQYSYEQLMRLQDTVGMVSRGASAEDITALRTLTVAQARLDGSGIVLGEQARRPSLARAQLRPLRPPQPAQHRAQCDATAPSSCLVGRATDARAGHHPAAARAGSFARSFA
jgi:hypothetical protein